MFYRYSIDDARIFHGWPPVIGYPPGIGYSTYNPWTLCCKYSSHLIPPRYSPDTLLDTLLDALLDALLDTLSDTLLDTLPDTHLTHSFTPRLEIIFQ
jgi:hypothetical protein